MFSWSDGMDLAVRMTIVLAVGWPLLWYLRGSNPRWSIAVSRAMIVALFVLPLGYGLAPVIRVAVLPAEEKEEVTQPAMTFNEPGEPSTSSPMRQPVPVAVNEETESHESISVVPPSVVVAVEPGQEPAGDAKVGRTTPPARSAPFSWRQGVLMVWLGVALGLAMRLLVGVTRTRRLVSRGVPCDEAVLADAKAVADTLGMGRIPRILIVDQLDGPCSAGWLRSVVLLPSQWMEKFAENERRVVLGHEMTHVAGRDPSWDFLARWATVLWWFHPLVWRLPQRHRLACEHVCDSVAAALTGDFATYRRRLASWALEVYGQRQGMLATLTMADRSLLHRRLRWLETSLQIRPIGRTKLALVSLLAVVLLAGVATIRPVRRVLAAMPLAMPPSDVPAAESEVPPASADAVAKQPPIVVPGKAAIDPSVTTPRVIRVVDEQERGLARAEVRVGAWVDATGESVFRAIVNPPVTNDEGEVTIDVPLGAVRVGISANAEGYVEGSGQLSLKGQPVLTLKRGQIVKVRAVDSEGNPLPNAYALLGGSYNDRRTFTRDDNGVLVSSVVNSDRRWLRVIDDGESDDVPTRFSDLIDVTAPKSAGADGVTEATLRPGVRLEGRLDDTVPRPIKDGQIDLAIIEGEGHQISVRDRRQSEDRPWQWRETAAVHPDGTFVFESLPPGGHVQLFALVQGYQSITPTEQEFRAYFEEHSAGKENVIEKAIERSTFMARIYPLDRVVVRVTLPCKPTASVDVRVVDPAGQPIEEATVSFNPNGYFLGGSQFIPGSWMPSSIKNGAFLPTGKSWGFTAFVFVKTNEDGIARVHSLPGEGSESYRVETEGYVMPIDPRSLGEQIGPRRYATVDLISGETQQRTITMERFVPSRQREVMVVDPRGQPLPEITVTITELTTSSEPDQWQQWSVQRFGNMVSEKSGEDGRLTLDCPVQIADQAVPWVRVSVTGRVGEDASVRAMVDLPTSDDGRVICLARSDQPPRFGRAYRKVTARYVKLDELTDASPRQLLERLVEKPELISLRRLLAVSGFDRAEPIELTAERNSMDDISAVVRFQAEGEEYVVVLCGVRPKGATWVDRPEYQSAPDAALIFTDDGTLVTVLGGGFSARGSREHVTLANLGGTGDYVIRVSAFEDHSPFEYISRWYRLGHQDAPALTVHHYANSNAWTPANGNGKPISEFGYLGYEFNGQDIDNTLPGVTNKGLDVPRRILWDGLRNQFIGPVEQSFDGKPLYRVVTDNSAEFLPLEAKPDEVIVTGGRRDFSNWHAWTVVVQESQAATARLILIADGKETRELLTVQLAPDQHSLQMQIDPDSQTEAESTVRFRAGTGQDDLTFTIPRMEIDASPSVADQPVAVSGKAPVRLFDKMLVDDKQSLVLKIEAADGNGE